MEREIKFQVLADNKVFGYERVNKTLWEWMCLELNPDNGERWIKGVFTNGTPLTRRQYTALKDKNEKEIYEGDILKLKDGTIVKVFFNSSMCSFDIEFEGGDLESLVGVDGWNESVQNAHEIIGNIYENPELIKS